MVDAPGKVENKIAGIILRGKLNEKMFKQIFCNETNDETHKLVSLV
jgi:hypothetical protein